VNVIDAMAQEYEHEAGVTRKVIERIPDDKLDWKPHEKSMSAGKLASHLAESQGWAKSIVEDDEFNVDADYKPFEGSSIAEILKTYDGLVAESLAAMKSGVSNETLTNPWTLKMNGQTMFEMPKGATLRMWMISHQIHHRGQLSVYLRMVGAPVPSIYGPSADEQG
jgi:uncharacterized damage-inducible protein DinB